MIQNDFAFDRWTDDGERIVEHVAGAEDFQIAIATYRWRTAMTLRRAGRQKRTGAGEWYQLGCFPFFCPELQPLVDLLCLRNLSQGGKCLPKPSSKQR